MIKQLKEFDTHFYDMVTVGERGQVVVPSKARKELGIKPGDKLIAMRSHNGRAMVLVNMKIKDAKTMFEKMAKTFSNFAAKYSERGQ
jgi:AbrB family looped-hinge helix DNA binding protein